MPSIRLLLFLVLAAQSVGVHPAGDTPGPRLTHSLVYDEQVRRIVLVDGYPDANMPDAGELWTWDGARWERIAGPGHPARSHSAAVYDAKRQQIVVFGGRVGKDGFTRGDTWEWNGNAWRDATGPGIGIRDHHSMAYDERRGRTVLYGGTVPPPDVAPRQQTHWEWPADTWERDGTRWIKMPADGPGSRNVSALAYDAARGNVVLFGGYGEDRVHRGDTWTWDGTTWKQAATTGPSGRAVHRMAFDSRAGVVLLYGGANATGRLQDMWAWDGRRWTEVPQTGPTPGPQVAHALAYDRARGRLVLYGGLSEGSAAMDDLWEWDGRTWTCVR